MCVDRQERYYSIISVVITAANTHDMKAAIKTIDGILAKRKRRIIFFTETESVS
jgi:hypothetical protein